MTTIENTKQEKNRMKAKHIVKECADGESYGTYEFDNAEEAQEKFSELKDVDGGRDTEEEENLIELLKLTTDEGGLEVDSETIEEQVLFTTGIIDHNRSVGEMGCFYHRAGKVVLLLKK